MVPIQSFLYWFNMLIHILYLIFNMECCHLSPEDKSVWWKIFFLICFHHCNVKTASMKKDNLITWPWTPSECTFIFIILNLLGGIPIQSLPQKKLWIIHSPVMTTKLFFEMTNILTVHTIFFNNPEWKPIQTSVKQAYV